MEKRREQEREHEERMLTMMMGFMQRMVGCPPTSSQHYSPSASRSFPMPSYPFTPCPDFPHSSLTLPFSPDHTFTTPTLVVTPPYYNDNGIWGTVDVMYSHAYSYLSRLFSPCL